jgi:hypothetical protein
MVKLKPCPFCGHDVGVQYKTGNHDILYPITRERDIWNLVCDVLSGGCGAVMLGDSKSECIELWNTRDGQYGE